MVVEHLNTLRTYYALYPERKTGWMWQTMEQKLVVLLTQYLKSSYLFLSSLRPVLTATN
jgi:hypothetical protein